MKSSCYYQLREGREVNQSPSTLAIQLFLKSNKTVGMDKDYHSRIDKNILLTTSQSINLCNSSKVMNCNTAPMDHRSFYLVRNVQHEVVPKLDIVL